MRPENLSKKAVISFILFGLAVSLFFNFRNLNNSVIPTNQPALADSLVGSPVRLIIEKIGVDATIENVGLTVNGAMGTPKGPEDVGWFSLGVRPGEVGSAVMDGHYGWKDNTPAVFDELNLLRRGDQVSVLDDDEVITVFVVSDIRIYGEDEDASAVFSSTDGGVHLNLITCEGIWDPVKKSYSGRLVVFTDKVSE